jgi:hypothetical protein
MGDIVETQCAPVQELRPIVLQIRKAPLIVGGTVLTLMLLIGVVVFQTEPAKLFMTIVGPGIGALACAIGLIPPSLRIELTPESLAVWLFWKRVEFVRWAEIENIRIGWYGYESILMRWNRWLFLDYSLDGRVKQVAICPFNYGFNAEEMMAFLSSYRERARAGAAKAPED